MVGIGGETRPTIGNSDPNTVVASGTVISGIVNFPGGAVFSGGVNLQYVSGFRWRGSLVASGHANGVGGALVSGNICHSETGFMEISLSGQQVYLAYWISA